MEDFKHKRIIKVVEGRERPFIIMPQADYYRMTKHIKNLQFKLAKHDAFKLTVEERIDSQIELVSNLIDVLTENLKYDDKVQDPRKNKPSKNNKG